MKLIQSVRRMKTKLLGYLIRRISLTRNSLEVKLLGKEGRDRSRGRYLDDMMMVMDVDTCKENESREKFLLASTIPGLENTYKHFIFNFT